MTALTAMATVRSFLRAATGQSRDDRNPCTNLCTLKYDDSLTGKVNRAIDYPYKREPTSYLFVQDGRTLCAKAFHYVKVNKDPMSAASTLRTPEGKIISVPKFLKAYGLVSDPKSPRTAVIGYGSNAAVEQLARKFGNHPDYGAFCGDPVIPVIKARIKDFDVVYMGHIASYGAVGATLTPSPGTKTDIWLTFLTPEQLERMHKTESRRQVYDYGTLEGVSITLENGNSMKKAGVYMDRVGALIWDDHLISLAAIDASNRLYPALLEGKMLDLLRMRFSPDAQLDNFILQNIGKENEQRRDERNSLLHKATRRFSSARFKVIE
jgi:hypothetical protein